MDESVVPMWFNRKLTDHYSKKLTKGKSRNFDLFDFLLNGIAPASDLETSETAASTEPSHA